jgi:hypothetical protein
VEAKTQDAKETCQGVGRTSPITQRQGDSIISAPKAAWVHGFVIVRKNATFPKDIEDRLLQYRKARTSDTGKLMFRETAIAELLRVALADFQPPKPVEDRLDDIEKRLRELEVDRVETARSEFQRRNSSR